ncbi:MULTISPECIES: hypothetical protein [Vibrio]|jgi:uncharacterized membrane protein (DUF106 family)|uniref:Holin (3TMs family) n=4 Tax=Vibrio TaxID=662 RepID=A0A4R2FRP7_9VIBR|nr:MULTISPECIES: hypothetical protein [Vibrio]MBB1464801.1 hypothetical protein [Vibrio sp. SG41-7]MDH5952405.1 hypothetical protein [Vibrio crassostreae]MDL5025610.1 hypothetical protein [Vibrio sp. TMPB1044]MDN5205738.1 hypothetical protein [Vibrio sp. TMPB1044]PMK09657.1 hypothetical protein BCU07_15290 [Vibrio sp. 10N.261.54.E10]
MIGAIANLITGGIDAYKQHGLNKANALKRQDELEQERHRAQVKRLQSGDEKAADLDRVSLKDRGLKDEFILLVVFVPLILSFIPDYAEYVQEGFKALEFVPEYYWYIVGAVVIDTFGFRSMVRYLLEFFSFKFRGK